MVVFLQNFKNNDKNKNVGQYKPRPLKCNGVKGLLSECILIQTIYESISHSTIVTVLHCLMLS